MWKLVCIAVLAPLLGFGAEATFYRGINLNGPALVIDGHAWEGDSTTNFTGTGEVFENQKVPLKPPTDAPRAQMIRSSR